MKVAFISHTADHTTFKVGSHHYAREFASNGWTVLHLSTPYSRVLDLLGREDERKLLAQKSPYVDDNRVLQLVPTRFLPARVSHRWLSLKHDVSVAGFEDANWVIVDQPMLHRAVDAFSNSTRVCYRPTDMYTEGAYAYGQSRMLERANAVVATSPVVLDELDIPDGLPTTVIENGVDLPRFTAAASLRPGRSGAVYVGALDDRFDWAALVEMARALAAESDEVVRVFGPAPADIPVSLPGNVRLEGRIDYDDVPRVLAAARVGLMPFKTTRLNEGRSPMKMFEYLAAGLSVVGPAYLDRASKELAGRLFFYTSNDEIDDCLRSAVAVGAADVDDRLAPEAWPHKAAQLELFLASIG